MALKLPAAFDSTHNTDGLPGYPAIDVFGRPGAIVTAPADGIVRNVHEIPWNTSKGVGGGTLYLDTRRGTYFLTHFGKIGVKSGQPVKAGQAIGTIARVPQGAWSPHIHEGFHAASGSGGPTPEQIELVNKYREQGYTLLQALQKAGVPANIGIVSPVGGGVKGTALGALGTASAAGDLASISSVVDAFKFLFSLRGLETIGGGVLLLMGLYLLVKQVGLAADIPVPLPGPAKAAATTISPEPRTRTVTRREIIYHPVGSAEGERIARRESPRYISDPATNEIPF